MNIENIIIIFLLLMLICDLKQAVAAGPERLYGIKEDELPEHYAQLFFGRMDVGKKLSLLEKVNAFVCVKGARSLAEKVRSKFVNIQAAKAKRQKGGKRGRGSGQKNAAESADTITIRNANALQQLSHELDRLEKLNEDAINKETLKSLERLWSIFKALPDINIDNFDGIELEIIIEEQKKISDNTDERDSDDHIRIELAPLHMEKIKHFLIRKSDHINDNKLAKAFEQRYTVEERIKEIVEAKDEMYRMVGKKMFEELELQEPLLFRIDRSIMRNWYEPMLANSIHSQLWMDLKQQLDIRYLFDGVLHLSRRKYFAKSDNGEEEQPSFDEAKYNAGILKWERKIFKNRGGQSPKDAYGELIKAYAELRKELNMDYNKSKIAHCLKEVHQIVLEDIYNTESYKQFLNATPGARARIHTILGELMSEKLMEFGWNIAINLEKLAAKYHEIAVSEVNKTDEFKLKRLKASVNADVLCQLFWLASFMWKQRKTGKIDWDPWWDNFRNRILLFLDHLVDANRKFTECYAILLNNMLYKFRILDLTGQEWDEKLKEQMEWSLTKLDEASRIEGEKEPMHYVEQPLEPEMRAEWLEKEHREMIKKLIGNENTETKQQLSDLSDKQMRRLAKSLNEGPNPKKEIEWKHWLIFIKERNKIVPQITAGLSEGKNNELGSTVALKQIEEIEETEEKVVEERESVAEETVRLKGKAPLIEEEEYSEKKEKEEHQNFQHDDEWNDNESVTLPDELRFRAIRLKAVVDLLMQIFWLDHNGQLAWTDVRPLFVRFLNNLMAGNFDQDWLKRRVILFGNIFHKLRCHWKDGEEGSWDWRVLLKTEVLELKHCIEWEQKGKTGTMPVFEVVDADLQEEWLQKEHAKVIGMLKEGENIGSSQQSFSDSTDETTRMRIKTAVDILLQLFWLEYNEQAAWTEFKLIFVRFLNQLVTRNFGDEWMRKSVVLYGNMFYKLRWHNGEEESWDLRALLKPELMEMKHFIEWEQEGKKGTLPVVEAIDADIQEEWLQKEHARIIGMLKEEGNIIFSQRLEDQPETKKRLPELVGIAEVKQQQLTEPLGRKNSESEEFGVTNKALINATEKKEREEEKADEKKKKEKGQESDEKITTISAESATLISESNTHLGTAKLSKKNRKKKKKTLTVVNMPFVNKPLEASKALQAILKEKGMEQSSDTIGDYHRIETAVNGLKEMVHRWKSEAILLFTGSYLLKLHTTDAGIDCVVLLPFEESPSHNWELVYKRFFFGNDAELLNHQNKEVQCDLESDNRLCTKLSLYCVLCMNKDVKILERTYGRDRLPMIQMRFEDTKFNISFVSMPKKILLDKHIFAAITFESPKEPEKYPAEAPQQESSPMFKEEEIKKDLEYIKNLDQMIAEFIDWMGMFNMDARKGMLWALSAYRANLQMKMLINKERSFDQFKTALMALKLWAKNHFVYGAIFGLLNGQTLTAMLLHVFQKNNVNDPMHLLLKNFFDTFSHWKWPKPVELQGVFNENSHEKYAHLDWNEQSEKYDRANQLHGHLFLAEHAQLVWPVIVPGFPTQNAAFNVNGWTKHAMQREFKNSLAKMESINETIMAEGSFEIDAISEQWNSWLYGEDFQEKFDHFVVIECAVQSAQHVHTFCDYVESRIRLQLLFSFGDVSQSQVQWMHASPKKLRDGTSCASWEKVQLPAAAAAGQWLCTIWLVGIQLSEGGEQGIEQILKGTEPPKKISSRLENFAGKIKADFDHQQRMARNEEQFTRELIATYMTKKELLK